MNTLSQIQKWGDTHHPTWFGFFRILLGLTLMYKGFQFATHLDDFSQLMARTTLVRSFAISFVAHLVIVVHLIGGLLIAIGASTRVACLVQIPILLAAIFYVNLPSTILKPYAELWLSVSVLAGLFVFAIEGDGPLSCEKRAWIKRDTARI